MTATTISTAHNEARLEATRAFLDSGSSSAKLRVYNGTRPVGGGTATTMLFELILDEPCGIVAAGVLTISTSDLPIILNSGDATWARFVNGNGDYAIDCDVSDAAGSAPVKLSSTTLYEGGAVTLLSAVLR